MEEKNENVKLLNSITMRSAARVEKEEIFEKESAPSRVIDQQRAVKGEELKIPLLDSSEMSGLAWVSSEDFFLQQRSCADLQLLMEGEM